MAHQRQVAAANPRTSPCGVRFVLFPQRNNPLILRSFLESLDVVSMFQARFFIWQERFLWKSGTRTRKGLSEKAVCQ